MIDYYAKILEAASEAESRGWVRVPGSYNPTWRRTVDHPTPTHVIEYGWWTRSLYSSHEFVSFILRGRNRAPGAVYRTSRTYWTPGSDRSISFKRALEVLAADTAEVHENHWEGDQ